MFQVICWVAILALLPAVIVLYAYAAILTVSLYRAVRKGSAATENAVVDPPNSYLK